MINQGWFDWMRRVPGPPDKVYTEVNNHAFVVPHSAVGYYHGWLARLFSQERDANNRYTTYAAVSVHVWVNYDGSAIQHYPIQASCWGSGSRYSNTHSISIEFEGGPSDNVSEPLRPQQVVTLIHILRELNDNPRYWHRPRDENDKDATLYEHRECTRFGSAPTACPSFRIPWDRILSYFGTRPPVLDGWHRIDNFWGLYNNSEIPFIRIGSTDGQFPGRISKLFGDKWYWLIKNVTGNAMWSEVEGD